MSDPKYNKYAGTVRFDDDNIVDIDLQPDTENIRVLLNGSEVTGGAELPEVDSGDNGKVLTVVSGEWAAATPATPPAELPAVTSDDNGDVLTVVAGEWAKAAPTAPSGVPVFFDLTYDADLQKFVSELTNQQIMTYASNNVPLIAVINDHGFIAYAYFTSANSLAESSAIQFTFTSFNYNASSQPCINVLAITAAGDISNTAYNINPQ